MMARPRESRELTHRRTMSRIASQTRLDVDGAMNSVLLILNPLILFGGGNGDRTRDLLCGRKQPRVLQPSVLSLKGYEVFLVA
jgi:hypothetical protein